MSDKLYAERDPMELEPWFSRHLSAMTGEGLHSKFAIAEELAFRDQKIERLRAEVKRLDARWMQENLESLVLKQDNATLREALKNHAEEAAKMVSAEPVAWIRYLVGAECKPDGRCYDIVFAQVEGYTPLFTSPRIQEGLEIDAQRYRCLRAQHWNDDTIAAVRCPKKAVKLGHDCPSGERLDSLIDAAMIAAAPKPE